MDAITTSSAFQIYTASTITLGLNLLDSLFAVASMVEVVEQ